MGGGGGGGGIGGFVSNVVRDVGVVAPAAVTKTIGSVVSDIPIVGQPIATYYTAINEVATAPAVGLADITGGKGPGTALSDYNADTKEGLTSAFKSLKTSAAIIAGGESGILESPTPDSTTSSKITGALGKATPSQLAGGGSPAQPSNMLPTPVKLPPEIIVLGAGLIGLLFLKGGRA